MSAPLVYHVEPAAGLWVVVRETHPEPLADFSDRESALAFARSESDKIGMAEVVVHGYDGSVLRVEPHHAGEPLWGAAPAW